MDFIVIIGLVAGTLTTVSFVPEVYKAWRTKSTRDLSSAWMITLAAGQFVWIAYGVLVNSVPLILANSISVFLSLLLISFKLRYK